MTSSFQSRVGVWCRNLFGEEIATHVPTRCFRFLEEALELVQALGCTKEQALTLVDYVFNRPVGAAAQEVGGTMVTLAALCEAAKIDMDSAGWIEQSRCETPEVREKILRKQATKVNKFGVLPGGEHWLKKGEVYTRKDGRRGVLVGPHPHDGALLVFNEVEREDDEIMVFFACERSELKEVQNA